MIYLVSEKVAKIIAEIIEVDWEDITPRNRLGK
jgi:hypothetical protein